MKYATNFPVMINKNNTISVFDTGPTIPKQALVQTHTYKVNGTYGNSLRPLRMTICTLEFPKKFQQQFIVCEHLL